MNLNRTAAMYQMNDQEAAMSNYPYGEPHSCDESRGNGEVKLACGCMLPVVAGALSPDGQLKLKQWQTDGTKYQWNKNHYNEGHRVHSVCSQEVTSQAGADDWII